ncbi:hypothetical protein [Motilimonas eburnea]|uniref:hypothetical protein n=1 Tax=Motilimonas eburnea TaxID=1737488 RepID=UPI001E288BEB|nr:hypothetical protein [Motilimonas eburnea]MCE2573531.1 hypothetical protein [Motilimonas eburnea]
MKIQSAFNIGVEGFQKAQQQVTNSANNIAQQAVANSSGVSETNNAAPLVQDGQTATTLLPNDRTQESVITELVNLKVAEHQAKASAKVITVADEMMGSIIDIKV